MPIMLVDPTGECPATLKNIQDDFIEGHGSFALARFHESDADSGPDPDPQQPGQPGGCGWNGSGGGGGGGWADGVSLDGGDITDYTGSGMGFAPAGGAAFLIRWLQAEAPLGSRDVWIQGFFYSLLMPDSGPGDGGGQGYSISPKQLKALAACVKELFGITLQSFNVAGGGQNGSFTGTTSDGAQVTITTDGTSFTVAGLNTIRYGGATPPSSQPDTTGLTLDGYYATKYFLGIGYSYRRFSPSANLIASNLKFADALSNQVHELGHSLADLTNQFKVVNGEGPQGAALQDCFNRKSAAQ
jgi:hypothetical protein